MKRAALYPGRSAVQLGIRDQFAPNDAGLSLLEPLMPETFRAAGYQTALTGKWHLGSTTAERRPLARGFDHFYGFLGPAVDFYTHVFTGPSGGVDWQRDGVTLNETGYTTDLIAAEEIRLLRTRDPAKPFLHLAPWKRWAQIWSPGCNGCRGPSPSASTDSGASAGTCFRGATRAWWSIPARRSVRSATTFI